MHFVFFRLQSHTSHKPQAVIHQVLGVYRGAAPKTRDTINHWCRHQYDSNWYEGDENKNKKEMVRALAEEIVVEMKYTLPLWNAVLTKAWCKMLDIGGKYKSAITAIPGIRMETTNTHKTRSRNGTGECNAGPSGVQCIVHTDP